MVYTKIEWTDPLSHSTARVMAFTGGGYVFDAFDGDGEELATEFFISFDDAIQRVNGWRQEHGVDPRYVA